MRGDRSRHGRRPARSLLKASLLATALSLGCFAAAAAVVTAPASATTPVSITTTSLPTAEPGVAYSAQLGATGGVAPYQWKLKSGSLPQGLTLSTSGLLSGTPSTTATAGPYDITIKVSDSTPVKKQTAKQSFVLPLGPDVWTPSTVPPGQGAKKTTPRENLGAVSCNTTGLCATVATYDKKGTGTVDQVGVRADGTWTLISAPLPEAAPASNAQLGPVTCDDAGLCVAVGSYDDTTGTAQLLAETYSAGTWTATQLPGGAFNTTLTAVACSGTTTCVAVGTCCGGGEVNPSGFVETYANGVWADGEAALPANASTDPVHEFSELGSVSCVGPGSCVAVGSYADSDNTSQGLIETLAGGTWAPTEAPLPSGLTDPNGSLSSVSCVTAEWCVAVGADDTNAKSENDTSQGLIETLSDGGWSPSTVPTSVDPSWQIVASDVSCGGEGSCVLTGYGDSSNSQTTFVATLSSGLWSAASLPGPATIFGPVSCASPGLCVVLGTSVTESPSSASSLEVWSDGTWTSSAAPLPADAATTIPNGTLNAVSCASSNFCAAVGSYDTSAGLQEALMDTTQSV